MISKQKKHNLNYSVIHTYSVISCSVCFQYKLHQTSIFGYPCFVLLRENTWITFIVCVICVFLLYTSNVSRNLNQLGYLLAAKQKFNRCTIYDLICYYFHWIAQFNLSPVFFFAHLLLCLSLVLNQFEFVLFRFFSFVFFWLGNWIHVECLQFGSNVKCVFFVFLLFLVVVCGSIWWTVIMNKHECILITISFAKLAFSFGIYALTHLLQCALFYSFGKYVVFFSFAQIIIHLLGFGIDNFSMAGRHLFHQHQTIDIVIIVVFFLVLNSYVQLAHFFYGNYTWWMFGSLSHVACPLLEESLDIQKPPHTKFLSSLYRNRVISVQKSWMVWFWLIFRNDFVFKL